MPVILIVGMLLENALGIGYFYLLYHANRKSTKHFTLIYYTHANRKSTRSLLLWITIPMLIENPVGLCYFDLVYVCC